MMSRRPAVVIAAAAAVLAGCSAPARITIEPGSHRDSLVFRLAPSGDGDSLALNGLVSFTVGVSGSGRARSAPGEVRGIQWQLVATQAARGTPAPRSIRYGEVPPGYQQTRRATILGPGSYQTIVMAPGTRGALRFDVSPDGRVK
jgi:hypothetical protein